jgi:hypothetical protein
LREWITRRRRIFRASGWRKGSRAREGRRAGEKFASSHHVVS